MSKSGGSGGSVSEVKLLFAERLFQINSRLELHGYVTFKYYQKAENRTTAWQPLMLSDSYYKTGT